MTRDDLIALILKRSSPKPIPVEYDGQAGFVRVMTAYDADATKKKLEAVKRDDGCETGRLLAMLLCDEEGGLLFDVSDAEAVLALAKLDPGLQMAYLNASRKSNEAPKS
jgi:hypothetical protein